MDVSLRVELLGGLRAMAGEREVTPFRRPKVAALFAYLAFYRERPHHREELMELLWPEIEPEAGRNNLRVTLHLLRQQLSQSGLSPERLLLSQRSTIQLAAGAFTTDVAEFETALRAARAAPPGERRQRLADAVALYRGELLPGFVEPWVLTERQPLAEAYQEGVQQLIGALEEAGDLDGAKEQARRAVSADPLREEAHYDLMRLYAATGQPAAAVRQYEELERLLRVELGETPSAATRALAEELRDSARTLLVPHAVRVRAGRPEREPSQRSPGAASPTVPSRVPIHPSGRGERVGAGPGEREMGAAGPAPDPTTLPGSPPHRLPIQFTRFYGREEEIARLTELLRVPAGTHEAGGRLVTLTGPGGSGKTRLAIAVAGRLEAEFEGQGGPWFVPLADLTEAQLIPDAIISALGLSRAEPWDAWEQVIAALQGQRSLLLLDNFEHLVEAGAPVVRALLERVPALTCLVTSRRRLEIEGELECVVLPLPTPRASDFGFWMPSGRLDFGLPATAKASGDRTPFPDPIQNPKSKIQNPEALLQYPSVALFVDRAQAAWADFALTSENAWAVAQLCDRLEGLPLAIELAASRAGVLTPEQMLVRLADDQERPRTGPGARRFELLVSRRRDVSSRHRSLRAAIEWSCRLLTAELRLFFARLSVFRGGWSLEAAEAVAGAGSGDLIPVLDHLEELRNASLVQVEAAPRDQAAMRYRLLEMLREYAAEQLSPEEQELLAERHARFFLTLAEQAEQARQGTERGQWLDQLEEEHDNLRAALDWCLGPGVQASGTRGAGGRSGVQEEQGRYPAPERLNARTRERVPAERLALGLRLAAALARFWFTRGFIREGRERMTLALAQVAGGPKATASGAMAGPPPAGIDPGLWGRALDGAGNLALAQSDFGAARALYEQCLALAEQRADSRGALETLNALGVVTTCEGSLAEARSFYERILALAEQLGDRSWMAQSLSGLGVVAELEGDYERAGSFFARSVPLALEVAPRGALVWTLHAWGFVTWKQGDLEAGRALLEESLALFQETGHRYGLARTLERLAGLAMAQQQPERAARLFGAAANLRELIGSPLGPLGQAELDRDVAAARDALGEPAFARALAEGAAMSLEQALQCATGAGLPPAS